MGNVRNKRFGLTRCHRERRWRKVYKGKAYHWPLLPGETKESSYPRCLELWRNLKQKLDAESYDPHRQKWEALLEVQITTIDECKQKDRELTAQYNEMHWSERDEVSPRLKENREACRNAFFMAESIRANLKAGTPFPSSAELGELRAIHEGA